MPISSQRERKGRGGRSQVPPVGSSIQTKYSIASKVWKDGDRNTGAWMTRRWVLLSVPLNKLYTLWIQNFIKPQTITWKSSRHCSDQAGSSWSVEFFSCKNTVQRGHNCLKKIKAPSQAPELGRLFHSSATRTDPPSCSQTSPKFPTWP